MRSTERNDPPGSAALPKGVVERSLLIVQSFADGAERHTLGEISRATGLPKPTVHRMLQELCRLGLIGRTGEDYTLGLRLFELGELVPFSRRLRERALPQLEALRETTRSRVHLAILDGVDVVYVMILGTSESPLPSRPGGRLRAHATGVGKALLAWSPRAALEARVAAGLPAFTPRTIIAPGALARALEKVRAEGLAYEREEYAKGVSCIAAPVFGPHGVAAAISVTNRTHSLDAAIAEPALRTAALALTRQLGGSPPE